MLLDAERPVVRGEKSRAVGAENRRKRIAKEERGAAIKLLAHHREKAESAKQPHTGEIEEGRRKNPKGTTKVEALERDAPRAVPLLEQSRRDQQSTDREKEVDPMRSEREIDRRCSRDRARLNSCDRRDSPSLRGWRSLANHPESGYSPSTSMWERYRSFVSSVADSVAVLHIKND